MPKQMRIEEDTITLLKSVKCLRKGQRFDNAFKICRKKVEKFIVADIKKYCLNITARHHSITIDT